MEATRSDVRKDQKEIAAGLNDLATALAITTIHRKHPNQAIRVPIIAESAEEVHRVAGLFGKVAEVDTSVEGSIHTRFDAYFGLERNVKLDIFYVEYPEVG